jgi:HPt (histidine-containing phosphotransfer) domain-containing protein
MAAVCNLGVALNRLGGNRELLRDLIGFFGDDAPKLLSQVTAGLQADDARQVQLAAHSLVGLVANFEALPSKTVAAQMETHARGGDLTAAANLLPELEANIQSLLAALGISPVAQSAAQPIAQSDAVESPER